MSFCRLEPGALDYLAEHSAAKMQPSSSNPLPLGEGIQLPGTVYSISKVGYISNFILNILCELLSYPCTLAPRCGFL